MIADRPRSDSYSIPVATEDLVRSAPNQVRYGLQRADVARSFVVYFLGTGSAFIADLYLSQTLAQQDLANWAFARSVIFIGASVCLVGVDQALLRTQMQTRTLLMGMLKQVGMLGPLVGGFAIAVGGLRVGLAAAIGAVSLSVLAALSGLHRSRFRIFRSHITVQLWKSPFLIASVILVTTQQAAIIPTGAAVVLVVWLLIAARHAMRETDAGGTGVAFRDLLPVGRRFWIAALIASGMQYLDQLLLNMGGTDASSANYFRYTALFAALTFFITGFAANILNPYLRQHTHSVKSLLPKLAVAVFAASLLSGVLAAGVGLLLSRALGSFPGGLNMRLVVLVCTIGALRLAYLLPSAIVGVFGSHRQLTNFLVLNSTTLISFGLLFLLFTEMAWLSDEYAVAIAALISSVARLSFSSALAFTIISSDEPLTLQL